MPNQANLEATLAVIESNPAHWDQSVWHCGTSHCFAGFAEMLRLGLTPTEECAIATPRYDFFVSHDYEVERVIIDEEATREWLGLTDSQWSDLVDESNTLKDLRRMVHDGFDEEDWDD